MDYSEGAMRARKIQIVEGIVDKLLQGDREMNTKQAWGKAQQDHPWLEESMHKEIFWDIWVVRKEKTAPEDDDGIASRLLGLVITAAFAYFMC